MGKTYEEIDDSLREFIARQRLFFVGTAPRSTEGLLNISPKGLDCFRILGPRQVAYLDMTGSGAETIAHLRENVGIDPEELRRQQHPVAKIVREGRQRIPLAVQPEHVLGKDGARIPAVTKDLRHRFSSATSAGPTRSVAGRCLGPPVTAP